jgi:TM2 domain-containing membrane protein YozV
MNGILFISLGALGCILFSLLIMFVFYWRHLSKIKKQGGDQWGESNLLLLQKINKT